MTALMESAPPLDHFFSTSAARLDRWRELNALAQKWAAESRSAKASGGRVAAEKSAVEKSLAALRPLEDFFAYPGIRLLKILAERIAADDALSTARMLQLMSGAML